MRVTDVNSAVRLELIADTETFPPAQLQAMLQEMELMIVESALADLSTSVRGTAV